MVGVVVEVEEGSEIAMAVVSDVAEKAVVHRNSAPHASCGVVRKGTGLTRIHCVQNNMCRTRPVVSETYPCPTQIRPSNWRVGAS